MLVMTIVLMYRGIFCPHLSWKWSTAVPEHFLDVVVELFWGSTLSSDFNLVCVNFFVSSNVVSLTFTPVPKHEALQ